MRFGKLIDHLRWAWPDVTWESGAFFATQQGVFAGTIIVCIDCTAMGLSLLAAQPIIDALHVIGALAFMLIAYGINKRSRIAAVSGLLLYLLESALLPASPDYRLWLLQLLLGVMFVNALRGTFAYHRYHKAVTL